MRLRHTDRVAVADTYIRRISRKFTYCCCSVKRACLESSTHACSLNLATYKEKKQQKGSGQHMCVFCMVMHGLVRRVSYCAVLSLSPCNERGMYVWVSLVSCVPAYLGRKHAALTAQKQSVSPATCKRTEAAQRKEIQHQPDRGHELSGGAHSDTALIQRRLPRPQHGHRCQAWQPYVQSCRRKQP